MSNTDHKHCETKQPKTVLVFGVFDLLHPGHLHFLEEAAKHGDRLVVVVTRDERCEAEKGRRPLHPLEERLRMVRTLPCVADALRGDPPGQWGMLERLAPDVVCVGHDQPTDSPAVLRQLSALVKRPILVRITAHEPQRYKTSVIRAAIHREG
ncbi:adenylyltransferase/cytidyltransferase family protein [Patescibacteria group bacterium]